MTSIRRPEPLGKRPPTAGIAFLVLLGTALALAAASACGGDDDTVPANFIGVTDAEAPRLGTSDAGPR